MADAKLKELDSQLSTRSFVCGGGDATQEDFERLAEIQGSTAGMAGLLHLSRWARQIRHLQQAFPLRTWPRAAGSAGGRGDGPKDQAQLEGKLKDAVEGKVCTRFPPEPSGYLHIGHAKAALLNHYYARTYKGKLILRFDDTNPSKEKQEFEDSIKEDLKLLEIFPDKVSHTSDYFDELQKFMEDAIKKGNAYVDDTEMLQMREERDKGIESKARSQSVAKNLELWCEMLKGSEVGLKNCVRGKMDMQNKNKCLRDPVFYRCKVDVPHHQHGFKYKAYPTYDWACPIVDAIEGVTHALRTIEYKDRDAMYEWVQEVTDSTRTNLTEFSKTQFTHTVLSKRKLLWFVEQGLVSGWDDPRFPTIRGIMRRGMTVPALLEFVMTQGASKATNLMEWDKIWAINKQKIDPVIPRYAAVGAEGAVCLELDGPAEPEGKMDKKHPKNDELGQRLIMLCNKVWVEADDAVEFNKGEEITLLHWGNAFIDEIKKDKSGKVASLKGRLNPQGDVKSTKKKVHWVPNLPEQVTPCIMRELDHIVTKPKIEDDDNIEDIVNPCSVVDTKGLGDPLLKTLQKGERLQLERRGYFIVDSVAFPPGEPVVLIKIPDGRASDASVVKSKVDPSKVQGAGDEKKADGGKQDLAALRAAAKAKKEASRALGKAGNAAAEPKKAKTEAPAAAGGGGGNEAAIAALGNEIRELKAKLKADGISGKQVDKNEEIIAKVAKLQELKSGAAAAPAPAPAAEAAKPKAKAAAGKPAERPIDDISRLDIRVGLIQKVWAHPEADKLWCEEIDLGEGAPRTIASGLREHLTEDKMVNQLVVVLANLKSRKMKGFESQGMVLCATDPKTGKVDLLQPPAGAKPGERVEVEGVEMLDADDKLNEKTGKAPLVAVSPDMLVKGSKATFRGGVWKTAAGPISCRSIAAGTIS